MFTVLNIYAGFINKHVALVAVEVRPSIQITFNQSFKLLLCPVRVRKPDAPSASTIRKVATHKTLTTTTMKFSAAAILLLYSPTYCRALFHSTGGPCTTMLTSGSNIQNAITNANTGDVICLASGVYKPSTTVTINKGVELRGPQSHVDPQVHRVHAFQSTRAKRL